MVSTGVAGGWQAAGCGVDVVDVVDMARVRAQLAAFVVMTRPVLHELPDDAPEGASAYYGPLADGDDVLYAFHGVEQLLDVVLPSWRVYAQGPDPSWKLRRDVVLRAIAEIDHGAVFQEMLGQQRPPQLVTGQLHPWVWDGARSLWNSGHYAEAVGAAARQVNARTQHKVGRRDVAETTLLQQCFSDDPPAPDKPRLRLPGDDGGRSAQSLRRGVRTYAEGCYAALRNPAAHDVATELSEHKALEQLAAFSILARWVDASRVVSA